MLSFLAALVLPACSGGGGSPTEPPAAVIAFTPDGAATARSFSLRRGSGTSGTRLQLELVATDVVGVHSVDFVLDLPSSNIVRFAGTGQGPFLGQNALLVAFALPAPFQGVLISDNRPPGTSGVSGSGVVMTIEIDALANGSGRIELTEPEVRDSQDRPIGGLTWIGGMVTVNR